MTDIFVVSDFFTSCIYIYIDIYTLDIYYIIDIHINIYYVQIFKLFLILKTLFFLKHDIYIFNFSVYICNVQLLRIFHDEPSLVHAYTYEHEQEMVRRGFKCFPHEQILFTISVVSVTQYKLSV